MRKFLTIWYPVCWLQNYTSKEDLGSIGYLELGEKPVQISVLFHDTKYRALVNYLDTKAKCSHLKKLTCK